MCIVAQPPRIHMTLIRAILPIRLKRPLENNARTLAYIASTTRIYTYIYTARSHPARVITDPFARVCLCVSIRTYYYYYCCYWSGTALALIKSRIAGAYSLASSDELYIYTTPTVTRELRSGYCLLDARNRRISKKAAEKAPDRLTHELRI